MGWINKLVTLFQCIVEIFLLFDYFNNFFEIKIKDKTVKIVFAGSCSVLFGINLLESSVVNLLFVPIVLWLFVHIVFDGKLGVKVGYFIMAYLIMAGVEFLYVVLHGITLEILSGMRIVPSEYGWQGIFVKLLNFILFLIIKQVSPHSKSCMTNKIFVSYLFMPISVMGMMIVLFYSGIDFKEQIELRVVLTLFFMFMVIGNMMLFYAFQEHAKNLSENAKQQVTLAYKNAEIKRLTEMVKINESYNEVVHNMAYYHKLIEHLAHENQNEKIYEVIKKVNGVLNERENYEYSGNGILDTILSEYSVKSKKIGIEFDVYAEPGCVFGKMKDMDFVVAIGNILENAVTAASKKGRGAVVVVRIYMNKNGKQCVIKVVNDYLGELKMKNGKLETTKKEKGVHGIGIKSVSKTVEGYGGFFQNYLENGKFCTVLMLPVE